SRLAVDAGTAGTRLPPRTAPVLADGAAPPGADRFARRADSQHRAARIARMATKTASCTLSRPAPDSQCAPRGTPNRPLDSRWLGVPSTVAERNSRYITLRNGHWTSSGRKPANGPVPSRL